MYFIELHHLVTTRPVDIPRLCFYTTQLAGAFSFETNGFHIVVIICLFQSLISSRKERFAFESFL